MEAAVQEVREQAEDARLEAEALRRRYSIEIGKQRNFIFGTSPRPRTRRPSDGISNQTEVRICFVVVREVLKYEAKFVINRASFVDGESTPKKIKSISCIVFFSFIKRSQNLRFGLVVDRSSKTRDWSTCFVDNVPNALEFLRTSGAPFLMLLIR